MEIIINEHKRSDVASKNDQTILEQKASTLYAKRIRISEQLNRASHIRLGAINLLAVARQNHQHRIQAQIDFVDSVLSGLKQELGDVNGDFMIYQHPNTPLPMITFDLKPTKEVNFSKYLGSFIESHYHESRTDYEQVFVKVNIARKMIERPKVCLEGMKSLKKYYRLLNLLYFRFFEPDEKITGLQFEWRDTFTGLTYRQRSIAYERGAILYNSAALRVQVAAGYDRNTSQGLQKCQQIYVEAARILNFLCENFSNSPGTDLNPLMVTVLGQIVMVQAYECYFNELILDHSSRATSYRFLVTYLNEASWLSKQYDQIATNHFGDLVGNHVRCLSHLMELADMSPLGDPIPQFCDFLTSQILPKSWIAILMIKFYYFRSLAYLTLSKSLIDLIKTSSNQIRMEENLAELLQECDTLIIFTKLSPTISLISSNLTNIENSETCHNREHRTNSRSRSTIPVSREKRSQSQKSSASSVDRSNGLMRNDIEEQNLPKPSIPRSLKDIAEICHASLDEAAHCLQRARQLMAKDKHLVKYDPLMTEINLRVNDVLSNFAQLQTLRSQPSTKTSLTSVPNQTIRNLKWKFRPKTVRRSKSVGSDQKQNESLRKRSHLTGFYLHNSETPHFESDQIQWLAPKFIPSSRPIVMPTYMDQSWTIIPSLDPFYQLGPIHIFNATTNLDKRIIIQIKNPNLSDLGFSIRGSAPVEVSEVDPNSPARQSGLLPGDLIVSICGQSVKWTNHETVVEIIEKKCNRFQTNFNSKYQNLLEFTIIRPT